MQNKKCTSKKNIITQSTIFIFFDELIIDLILISLNLKFIAIKTKNFVLPNNGIA